MNMISEQEEKLREIADYLLLGLSDRFDFTDVGHKIQEVADTMEALSAKLAAANMERSDRYYEVRKELIEQHNKAF